MGRQVIVNGTYCQHGSRHASTHWEQVCADHEEEFPQIRECIPGTFNMVLADDSLYSPPNESKYRCMAQERGRAVNRYEDGNHLSPCSKVIEINNKSVLAWIYRGGHRNARILELVSRDPLAEYLNIKDGAEITAVIAEVPEGSPDMPAPPPPRPGKTVETP